MAVETDIAWAAGVFDGEGHISVRQTNTKHGYAGTYSFAIIVKMVHKPTILRLQEVFGGAGKVYKHKRDIATMGKCRVQWTWHVPTISAWMVLEMMQPYLVTKAPEAAIAVRYYTEIGVMTRADGMKNGLSPERVAARAALAAELVAARKYEWTE